MSTASPGLGGIGTMRGDITSSGGIEVSRWNLLAGFASRLPPAAADKLRVLQQQADDARALLEPIAEKRDSLSRKKRELERRLAAAPMKRSMVRTEDPDAPQQRAMVASLSIDLQRLDGQYEQRHAALDGARRLVSSVTTYLDGCPQGPIPGHTGPLAVDLNPVPFTVEEIREKIAGLKADLHATRSAPRPRAEARAAARQIVERLAARGAPHTGALLDGVDEVGWEKFDTTVFHNVMEVIAWLDPERMTKRLCAEIDQLAEDDSQALSAADRAKRERALQTELLENERLEESIVERSGGKIPRRHNSDPRAVLNLSSDLPEPGDA